MESRDRKNTRKNKQNRRHSASHPVGHSELYLELGSPAGLHKNILEAQKEVIISLRRFEAIHTLRREKLREFMKLKRAVNLASHMIIEMKNYFPHVESRIARLTHEEQPTAEPRTISSADESELHRLDRELGEIERKLKEL